MYLHMHSTHKNIASPIYVYIIVYCDLHGYRSQKYTYVRLDDKSQVSKDHILVLWILSNLMPKSLIIDKFSTQKYNFECDSIFTWFCISSIQIGMKMWYTIVHMILKVCNDRHLVIIHAHIRM